MKSSNNILPHSPLSLDPDLDSPMHCLKEKFSDYTWLWMLQLVVCCKDLTHPTTN